MTKEEKELIFNRLLELEERHPAFTENVRDNAYCEAIADVKRIIERINETCLPSNLDEAAIDAAQLDMQDRQIMEATNDERLRYSRIFRHGFKAGAEWMAGQGETIESLIWRDDDDKLFIEAFVDENKFKMADNVTIQIRKKQ